MRSPAPLVQFMSEFKARHEEDERRLMKDPAFRAERARLAEQERLREEHERLAFEASKRQSRERRRTAAGIPDGHWPWLDELSETDSVCVVRAFAEDAEKRTLALLGSVGTGKSVAACAYLDWPLTRKEWRGEVMTDRGAGRHEERPLSALFVSARPLARISDYAEERWDELRRVDRLVIDDLGRETLDSKGRALANIVDLLCERHDRARRTVITANMTTPQFRARYCAADGGRLWDRLLQAGIFYELGGESMRRPTPRTAKTSRNSPSRAPGKEADPS